MWARVRAHKQLLEGIERLLDKIGTRNVTNRPPMPDDETVVEQRIKVSVRACVRACVLV